jgi:hypothetical protein
VIAALFVEKGGAYYGLEGVDPWDLERDARLYAGPWPVVAHPPCSSWGHMAHLNQKRYGHLVGDDGGCFESAVESVRRWGGVLEHPADSHAWRSFNLPPPRRGRWTRLTTVSPAFDECWTTEVCQGAYGHRAIKRTWLYFVGPGRPPPLDWSTPVPTAKVSYCKNNGGSDLPVLSPKNARATPLAFRDLLLSMARSVGQERAA